METTFDRFITNNPEEKAKFDKEYEEFLISEFILERMEEEKLSVRGFAKKANVSHTVIQKMRNGRTAEKISMHTFLSVLDTLGYKMNLVRK